MNSLIKKIGTGLIACAIAVMSVGFINTNVYAEEGAPCDGATFNEKLDVTKAKTPHECSVCIGSKLAEGQISEKGAFDKCMSASGYTVNNIWSWVYTIINWVLIAVGIIAVVFIIIGGVRYATSSGDSDKVKNAKNTILYAVIGLVVAILARVIVEVVFQVTGTIVTPEG
ncbi:pilin [Ruminococcaceae bacterium OttesenSCG-928-A11]|nr:pilin [Ruminococcaceae bacterium OttesenSCG-928-A11]